MSEFTLRTLQDEQKVWAVHNFGDSAITLAYRPLLGMCEELAEYTTAETAEEMIDAIADFTIFAANYCSCIGLDLKHTFSYRKELAEKLDYGTLVRQLKSIPTTLLHLVGNLQHHHLKMEQGIRGGRVKHLANIQAYLGALFVTLESVLSIVSDGKSFIDCVEDVWREVQKRDFTINSLDGGC